MAELTNLDTKLAEVLGLSMAAQGATEKVEKLVEDDELKQRLQEMREEAVETEQRTTSLVEELDGKKTAILEKARETKREATEMMQTYLGDDADGLDGFEFLTMAEAGEIGHWEIVGVMGDRARNAQVQQLVKWAIPIQKRHFEQTLQGSVKLAHEEDPNEPAE